MGKRAQPAAAAVEDDKVDAPLHRQPGAGRADGPAAADEQDPETAHGPTLGSRSLLRGCTLPLACRQLWPRAPGRFAGCPGELAVTMTSSPTCGETHDARGSGAVGSARRAECAQAGGTHAARSAADRRPARARVARGSAAATRAAAGPPSFLAVPRRPVTPAPGRPAARS